MADIVSPNMSPQADAAVQGAMERAAEAQDRVSSSNADELSELVEIRQVIAPAFLDGTPNTNDVAELLLPWINTNYLPKAKVVEAIGEVEDSDVMPHWCTSRNNLRHEIKRKLGLES